MVDDWYEKARKAFLDDLAMINGVSPQAAKAVYSYLFDEGVVDYDIEKEYLYDNYVEEEIEDE